MKTVVTGGISCGKSSVCQIFEKLGACVVSADRIVHQQLSSNKDLIEKIVELLGSEVLVNGQIDRKIIANIVFKHTEKLNALEALIHPVVRKEIEKEYHRAVNEGTTKVFVAEIPLYFEGHLDAYDKVIVVDAPLEFCKQRSKLTDFEARNARLMPIQEKKERADFIIYNEGDFNSLEKQVKSIYQQLTSIQGE